MLTLNGLGKQRSDEQAEAPAKESVPSGQGMHCDCDIKPGDELYVPGTHGVGAPSDLWQ